MGTSLSRGLHRLKLNSRVLLPHTTTPLKLSRTTRLSLEDSTSKSLNLLLPIRILARSRLRLRRILLLSQEIIKILLRSSNLLMTVPRRPLRMKSEASVSASRKLKPTQLQPAREPSKRWKSASKNLLTNLMRKLKCTRDNLKNRRLFPTPTLCVSRSSSVSSKALKQEQRKPNPHLTNSDQENVFLLLHQFD